jgi:aminoglycoside phosphotransferase (APT) family kinase protein
VVRVKAPPLDLDADLIERVLDRHWGIRTAELRYLPVGFGDHHWHVNAAWDNYFVTVRDLRLDGRADDRKQVLLLLEQTFKAVRQLSQLADLNFIVPAVPTTSGSLVVPLGDHFALSVYNWLDVQPAQDADGVIAAGLVARLHVASRERPAAAVVEDFRIPHRSALEASLADLERPWHTGPFGEQARAEVVAHQAAIQSALEQYDTLVAAAGTSSRDWCLTHGEPSGANLVQDQTGAHYLVDWESARVAPPERDLVGLGSSDWALDHYRQLAESPPARADLLRLYRLWYALAETSVYLLQFRASHTADDNMVESWQNFLTFLPGRQGSVF